MGGLEAWEGLKLHRDCHATAVGMGERLRQLAEITCEEGITRGDYQVATPEGIHERHSQFLGGARAMQQQKGPLAFDKERQLPQPPALRRSPAQERSRPQQVVTQTWSIGSCTRTRKSCRPAVGHIAPQQGVQDPGRPQNCSRRRHFSHSLSMIRHSHIKPPSSHN